MYSNIIRSDEPQKLGGLQPPSPPFVYTLAALYYCLFGDLVEVRNY